MEKFITTQLVSKEALFHGRARAPLGLLRDLVYLYHKLGGIGPLV